MSEVRLSFVFLLVGCVEKCCVGKLGTKDC